MLRFTSQHIEKTILTPADHLCRAPQPRGITWVGTGETFPGQKLETLTEKVRFWGCVVSQATGAGQVIEKYWKSK